MSDNNPGAFSNAVFCLVFGGLAFMLLLVLSNGRANKGIMIDALELPDCASRPVLKCNVSR